ncbi:VCBS repeat-containing protein [Dyadobacter sp. NIV53]|uniref:FG-GAP repeat domain-containing protein n=1 Tax=Dyadobacter sp. NIV53 TaxID=2861765 RepID=UPI001E2FFA6E|nr:VCBS repeat-containing protein [Dyadobacter sp. NIV53]
MQTRISFSLLIVTYMSVFSIFLVSCNENKDKQQIEKLAKQEKLVGQYCSSCHLKPDPSLLDKEIWRDRVLPAMAKQLGLEVWRGSKYYQNEKSAISLSDWMQIVAYYDSLAPQHLPVAKAPTPLVKDQAIFSLKMPQENAAKIAMTTLVAIDSGTKQIYTSDAGLAGLYQWNGALQQTASTQLPSPAVQVGFAKDKNAVLTCIGELKAQDIPSGNLLNINLADKKFSSEIIASNLIRPIHSASADFNKDGLMDYVVSSFGHNRGGLFLVKQLAGKTFRTIPIREIAGATQSVVQDFNNDGWPDIMALFAHGDEGIWLFLNDRKGGFTTKNILRFPPVYGSSSFQVVDMNKDGKMDIVYTSGDNSDYSRILKPYHGLYIFTNTGNMDFKKTYFYPVNGCTKAIATDFDQDGDMDIAAIAFFADFKDKPEESFIYFEQDNTSLKTALKFKAHAVPIYKNGRWICMDVNDYDGDGDQDIVLGNYSKGFLNQEKFKPNWNMHIPFMILENNLK